MRALCLALAVMLALPVAALAHAQLRGADPAPGAMLADMPDQVRLRFNEPVAPLVMRWIGPNGAITDLLAEAQGEHLIITPPAGLGAGTQFVSWRVVSADGHPVGGMHSFHVGAATMQAAPDDPAATGAARVAVAARAVLTLVLAIAIGAVLVPALITVAPPTSGLRRGGLVAVALGLCAGLVLVAAEGLNLLSLPPAALLTAGPWQAVQASPLPGAVVLIGLALGFAALGMARTADHRGGRVALAICAWALGAGSFALSGHGTTAAPQILARGALAVHGAALLFWIGALWPLLQLLRAGGAVPALGRFSNLAIPMVALLVLSGLILSWLQIGDPMNFLGTAWGVILTLKMALVLGLLGLALRNRLILTPALASGARGAAPRMARAIRAEIVLAVIIVILASSLRLVPPPRALAASAEPVLVHLHDPRAMADVRITPSHNGQITLEMWFQTGTFEQLVPRAVSLTLAWPAAGIEPIRAEAILGPDGLWQAGPLALPLSGDWDVALRVRITDFDSVTLRQTVPIQP